MVYSNQYPFRDAPFTPMGVSYQQALSNYISQALGGTISASQYPEGGSGRIVQMGARAEPAAEEAPAEEEPAALPAAGGVPIPIAVIIGLAGIGLTGLGVWLRRRS